jgi:hypothetical protein
VNEIKHDSQIIRSEQQPEKERERERERHKLLSLSISFEEKNIAASCSPNRQFFCAATSIITH